MEEEIFTSSLVVQVAPHNFPLFPSKQNLKNVLLELKRFEVYKNE